MEEVCHARRYLDDLTARHADVPVSGRSRAALFPDAGILRPLIRTCQRNYSCRN